MKSTHGEIYISSLATPWGWYSTLKPQKSGFLIFKRNKNLVIIHDDQVVCEQTKNNDYYYLYIKVTIIILLTCNKVWDCVCGSMKHGFSLLSHLILLWLKWFAVTSQFCVVGWSNIWHHIAIQTIVVVVLLASNNNSSNSSSSIIVVTKIVWTLPRVVRRLSRSFSSFFLSFLFLSFLFYYFIVVFFPLHLAFSSFLVSGVCFCCVFIAKCHCLLYLPDLLGQWRLISIIFLFFLRYYLDTTPKTANCQMNSFHNR